jgi:hypothetical protein
VSAARADGCWMIGICFRGWPLSTQNYYRDDPVPARVLQPQVANSENRPHTPHLWVRQSDKVALCQLGLGLQRGLDISAPILFGNQSRPGKAKLADFGPKALQVQRSFDLIFGALVGHRHVRIVPYIPPPPFAFRHPMAHKSHLSSTKTETVVCFFSRRRTEI